MNDNKPASATEWSFKTTQGGNGLWIALGTHISGQSTVTSDQNEAAALRRCKEIASGLSTAEES